MKSRKTFTTNLILFFGVIILINILSDNFFTRIDLTKDKRFTLSKATRNILKDLDEPVTITAFFTEDLPTQYSKTRRDFKELLIEYDNLSRGNILYEFVNPNEDEESEKKAMQAGINPVIVNIREKDQVKQQKAYMGAVVQKGEQSEIIPFMQPGSAMEYALSTSIKKLSVKDKPTIGIIENNGSAGISSMQQAVSSLSVLYKVEPVNLSDSSLNLSKYRALALLAPTDTFSAFQLYQLDNYLANGGNLFIGLNTVEFDLATNQGKPVETGLVQWLSDKGIIVDKNFVLDANCARATVPQRFGNMMIQSQIPFPYVPIVSGFSDHPAAKGLEAIVMEYVSSVSFAGDTSITFTPLMKSSKKSATQGLPVYLNIQKRWEDKDFPVSEITLGGAFTGKLAGNTPSRLIVIGDGNFPVNGEGQAYKQLQPDNVSLFVNAVDWLSDDTGLIDLRTKGITSRPLDQIKDSTKALLKYLNFLLPILLIIIYGIIRSQSNRNKRVKRMEVGHV